jgi:hypothetical protein
MHRREREDSIITFVSLRGRGPSGSDEAWLRRQRAKVAEETQRRPELQAALAKGIDLIMALPKRATRAQVNTTKRKLARIVKDVPAAKALARKGTDARYAVREERPRLTSY